MEALWWILIIIVAIPLIAGILNLRRRQARRDRDLQRIRQRLAEKQAEQAAQEDDI
ncbi:MAG: hypothetical protein AAF513_05295 [Pseudomonadota bacterium]